MKQSIIGSTLSYCIQTATSSKKSNWTTSGNEYQQQQHEECRKITRYMLEYVCKPI